MIFFVCASPTCWRSDFDKATATSWSGGMVAVTGGAGAGTSVLAMALAQGLATDPRYTDLTLLADLALESDHQLVEVVRLQRPEVPGLSARVLGAGIARDLLAVRVGLFIDAVDAVLGAVDQRVAGRIKVDVAHF